MKRGRKQEARKPGKNLGLSPKISADSFYLQRGRREIQQERALVTRGAQIRADYSVMDVFNRFDRLQLDDDLVGHQQIETMFSDRTAMKNNRYDDLPAEWESGFG